MKPVLLRTAWQTRNIGDVCFTPAMCARLRGLFPGRKIICWAARTTPAIRALAEAACPGVEWLSGGPARQGSPADPATLDAFETAGAFLYNSGPLLHYSGDLQQWDGFARNLAPLVLCRERNIPYAVYGQSFESLAPPADILAREVLSDAAFVTCRDTRSRRTLLAAGVRADRVTFSPDIAFSYPQLDPVRADAFLKEQGLEPGRFLGFCCHYAVEHRAPLAERAGWHLDRLRRVLVRWVRETGLPVLLYPEDDREIGLHRREFTDALPAEVRNRIRLRETFWLPDEAAAVLRRARVLFSTEPHSMIMTLQYGVPPLHPMHWAFGCKAQMWDDLGLADWRFDMDACDAECMADALLAVHADWESARARAAAAAESVRERMRQTDALLLRL